MLKTLRIEGFRCLRDLTLEFETGQPMILLGANGSGKSTVMEALLFLEQLFDQNPLDRVLSWHSGGDALPWRGSGSDGRLRFTLTSEGDSPWVYQLELGPSARGLDIQTERLVRGEQELLVREGDATTIYNVTTQSIDSFRSDREPVLIGLRQRSFYPWRDEVVALFGGNRIYPGFKVGQPWMHAPDGRRPASSATVESNLYLTRNGDNLINTLHQLYSYDDDRWKAIAEDFRKEFERCVRFRFVPSDQTPGQMRFQWLDDWSHDKSWFGLGHMSDGMVSYLMALTAIHGAPDGSLIAFDEPEIHLHPSLLRRVTDRLMEASTERRVVVATHSDALLDALEEDAIGALRVMRFDREVGSMFVTLDQEVLASWRQEYRFGVLRAMDLLKTAQ